MHKNFGQGFLAGSPVWPCFPDCNITLCSCPWLEMSYSLQSVISQNKSMYCCLNHRSSFSLFCLWFQWMPLLVYIQSFVLYFNVNWFTTTFGNRNTKFLHALCVDPYYIFNIPVTNFNVIFGQQFLIWECLSCAFWCTMPTLCCLGSSNSNGDCCTHTRSMHTHQTACASTQNINQHRTQATSERCV